MKTLIITTLVVVLAFGLYAISRVRSQLAVIKTQDTIGQILVAVDKASGGASAEYDFVRQTRAYFPSVPVKDGKIIDSWGNVIKIITVPEFDGLRIDIISAGPDRVYGTSDDIVRSELLRKR